MRFQRCNSCHVLKSLYYFGLRKEGTNRKECNRCRSRREKSRIARFTPKQREQWLQNLKERQSRYMVEEPFYWIAKLVKTRAKKKGEKGYELITPLFLQQLWNHQKGRCALTGRKMLLNHVEKRGWRTQNKRVSVDRKDSKGEYVKDNVWLVCAAANLCKNAYDLEFFLSLCRDIAKRHP